MKKKLFFIALLFYGGCLSAQTVHEVRDSVQIHFRQGKIDLSPSVGDNRSALARIADSLRTSYADSIYRLQRILVVGGASPEGSVRINRWLSEKRAGVLFDYLSRYGALPDSLKASEFLGRDWGGLIRLVMDDPDVPYREETLALLREIADEARGAAPAKGDHLGRIQRLRGGAPYWYMYKRHFPDLRASRLYLWYEKVWNPAAPIPQPKAEILVPPVDTVIIRDTIYIHDTLYVARPCPERPFYMALKTNMLYDALLIPNIGVEFYLGRNWSVAADWMYGWWKTDRRHWYWRAYGGGISVRKWFGRAAEEKPLTGHHLGLYGQIFTYDFETGGRGYMGGKPGGTLWDKMNYAAGVEYGYSHPIARRLNIDFTIGVGYWGGTYHEYKPVDGCYVWQSTRQRHWFGPTKAEVSLVWLLGHGNYNKGKGGRR
ncbi:DUF3575 domain-containing protein [Bacteroides sp. 14(A)]|uniref:DUF3575 domain-containing protein n=1 Tax=Bacteroides sp. 14(A) TaxID=1163670 RepID=UPI00047857A9|nr:DUF3575 domain-containing protein [Bacteroides sp. 14(A)]